MFPFSTNHNDLIEKTDDDGTVQVYSFKECNRDSPSELKQYRGVVYAGERRVFRSYGFTPEYTSNEIDELCQTELIDDYRFFPSEEGTLLRVFYVLENDKWYLSTHRKLDAFKSRWGNASNFGELFLDAVSKLDDFKDVQRTDLWEKFTSKLDKENVYFFLLRNTKDNRIVCSAPDEPTFYHIGTMVGGEKYVMVDEGFPRLSELYFTAWEELTEYVRNINPLEKQGVIGIGCRDGNQIKILHPDNLMYAEVRGNEPSVLYRYLQIRRDGEIVKKFKTLYPEYVNMFMEKESIILKVCNDIHKAYLGRYVYKKHVIMPKEEYRIMKDCHVWHQTDYKKNRVTLPVVVDMIGREMFVPGLFSILKRLEKESGK